MGTFNICIIFKGSKTKLLLTCICLTFLVTFIFISDTILFMKAQTLMGQVNEVVGFKKTKKQPKTFMYLHVLLWFLKVGEIQLSCYVC